MTRFFRRSLSLKKVFSLIVERFTKAASQARVRRNRDYDDWGLRRPQRRRRLGAPSRRRSLRLSATSLTWWFVRATMSFVFSRTSPATIGSLERSSSPCPTRGPPRDDLRRPHLLGETMFIQPACRHLQIRPSSMSIPTTNLKIASFLVIAERYRTGGKKEGRL